MTFDLLPKVYRTEGDVVDFDPEKIFLSVLNETGMTEEKARNVTELVMRRIISSGMKFLSGPHIREIVCSILSENHYEQERKLYTRIGMPLMDYEEILERGQKDRFDISMNPETVHHIAANQLAREYTLLRILNDEQSRAHLSGDIYIHQLKYFDLRPYSQIWDPRIILKNGLPPQEDWKVPYKSAPATNLRGAINQLTNWLGMNHNEFSGNQGFFQIPMFLAPYARGLSYETIKREIRNFILEINWLYSITGARFSKSSVCCTPDINERFKKVPATGPSGNEIGHYGDYTQECLALFNAFSEIYTEGDYNGIGFSIPRRLVYFSDQWISDFPETYNLIYREIKKMKTPILINYCPDWMISESPSQLNQSYLKHGVLQKISLNLPRYSYLSRNEDLFLEHLENMLNLCFSILGKKFEIIRKRLKTNHLPLCNGQVNGQPIYDLNEQLMSVGFTGLNEAVKFITGNALHEDPSAFSLGKKIVNHMADLCDKKSKEDQHNYSLIESSSKNALYRFAKLDLRNFPNSALTHDNGDFKSYTNSTHFTESADLPLLEKLRKQGEFHPIIRYGIVSRISSKDFEENLQNFEEFRNLLRNICKNTQLRYIKFA